MEVRGGEGGLDAQKRTAMAWAKVRTTAMHNEHRPKRNERIGIILPGLIHLRGGRGREGQCARRSLPSSPSGSLPGLSILIVPCELQTRGCIAEGASEPLLSVWTSARRPDERDRARRSVGESVSVRMNSRA